MDTPDRFVYACAAETDGHGRCRNNSVEGDPTNFCTHHANMRDSGQKVRFAPTPTKVLVKANVNPKWAKKLTELGVPVKHPDFEKLDQKHAEDAETHGRKANAIRDIADSGVPVFGKSGISDISVAQLVVELAMLGFMATDCHIFQRRDQGVMNVLVVTFEKKVTEFVLSDEIEQLFAKSRWGFIHVWDNPPKKDGTVLHTINLSHRSDEKAEQELRFSGGLYAIEPC
jgi:hypothetical protein